MADLPPGKKSGLTCWLLDTRTLWPGKSIAASAEVGTTTTLHFLGAPGLLRLSRHLTSTLRVERQFSRSAAMQSTRTDPIHRHKKP